MGIYNFSAGPAMFPKEVMLQAQEEFCNFKGSTDSKFDFSYMI